MADGKCVLCGGLKSKNCRFFVYPFSAEVLSKVMAHVGKVNPIIWDEVLLWGIHALKRKTVRNLVTKLALQFYLYDFWREREKFKDS